MGPFHSRGEPHRCRQDCRCCSHLNLRPVHSCRRNPTIHSGQKCPVHYTRCRLAPTIAARTGYVHRAQSSQKHPKYDHPHEQAGISLIKGTLLTHVRMSKGEVVQVALWDSMKCFGIGLTENSIRKAGCGVPLKLKRTQSRSWTGVSCYIGRHLTLGASI